MVPLSVLVITTFALACQIVLPGGLRIYEGSKEEPWRPILSKAIYQELANREAAIIRAKLNEPPEEKAISRAKLGAVLIGALTISVKDGADDLRGTRVTALLLAETLKDKGQLDAAKKLAALLPNSPLPSNAPQDKINWLGHLQHPDLMDHFRPKGKGGDGIDPDLQSNIRLKGALNSVEDKVRALATKELTDAGMKTEAKELELLAYRIAVSASLQYDHVPAPKDGKDFAQIWRTLSAQMRDHSVSLALAAKKNDTAAVHKASTDLNTACNHCHDLVNQFRVKKR
jgi:hypothetical protein